jgi:hypothetical protein
MKNRERLLKTNEYDLLCRIQSNVNYADKARCVLGYIDNTLDNHAISNMCNTYISCEYCIEHWLNSDENCSSTLG